MKNRVTCVALALSAVLLVVLARNIPVMVDYPHFRDAGRAMVNRVSLDDPYFFNVPWLAALLIPFSVQDDATGNGLLFVCGLAAFAYVAYRFGARPLTLVLFLTSPGVIANLILPNIDWLPLLGTLLSPRYGLFLVLVKPQVGLGVAILWLYQAWKSGRWQGVLKTVAPVALAFLVSIPLFGLWFMKSTMLGSVGWNTSLFPWSVPFGLLLLVIALYRSRRDWAIASSVLVSPYVSNPSWAGPFLSFATSARMMLAASLFWWTYRILYQNLR